MCKAKQVNLMCIECQQAVLKELQKKGVSQQDVDMMKMQGFDLKQLGMNLQKQESNSFSDKSDEQSTSSAEVQLNCQCKALVEESKENVIVMKSFGFMIPDPKIKSFDPSKSSDFMIVDSQICGVADGVSQWKRYQINPRIFGEELLTNVREVKKQRKENKTNLQEESTEILLEAFKKMTAAGSSTIIYYFIEKNILHLTWIGDSQAIILRRSKENKRYEVIYQTQVDQYGFNAPKQLIIWPSFSFVQKLFKRNTQLGMELKELIDSSQPSNLIQPQDAKHYEIEIQDGDLIICGTDGFFDNISIQQILQKLNEDQETFNQEKMAEELCKQAWDLSQLQNYQSPFATEAKKHGIKFNGGKKDDCTVVITKIHSC